jgi:hypothetical protein
MLFLPDSTQRRISGIGKEGRPLYARLGPVVFYAVTAGEAIRVFTGKTGFVDRTMAPRASNTRHPPTAQCGEADQRETDGEAR